MTIRNEAENKAIIEFTGAIGYDIWADTYDEYKANTKEQKKKELEELSKLGVKDVEIRINSLGGDVEHASAIYALLRNSGKTVTTKYYGHNASAATIIGSAGSNISMSNAGYFLVHKASTMAYGNENEIAETIDALKQHDKGIKNVYKAIGVSEEDVNSLMEANNGKGTWLTADEALQYGFIDSIYDSEPVLNVSNTDLVKLGLPINNKLTNLKIETMADEAKEVVLTEEQETGIINKIKAFLTPKEEAKETETLAVSNEADIAKISELEGVISNKEQELKDVATALEEKDETIANLNNEVKDLTAKIEALEAKEGAEEVVIEKVEMSNEEFAKLPVWKQILNTHNKINS